MACGPARLFISNDPDEFVTMVRPSGCKLQVTGRGEFRARGTLIDLGEIYAQRASERLARVARVEITRSGLLFHTKPGPSNVLGRRGNQPADDAQRFDRRPIMQKSRLDRIASPPIVQEKIAGRPARDRCISMGVGHEAVEAQSLQRRRANFLHEVCILRQHHSAGVSEYWYSDPPCPPAISIPCRASINQSRCRTKMEKSSDQMGSRYAYSNARETHS